MLSSVLTQKFREMYHHRIRKQSEEPLEFIKRTLSSYPCGWETATGGDAQGSSGHVLPAHGLLSGLEFTSSRRSVLLLLT